MVRMGFDRCLFTAHHQGHHQLKPAALSCCRRDFNAPAHQLGQLPANGQPQTTATKPSGDGTIDLRERAEQLWQPLSRNAHARVGHAEHQLHCTGRNGPLGCLGNRLSIDVLIGLRHTHVQHNFTFFCELHGVVGQVRQHLTEPQRVTLQAARHVLVNQQQQLQPFFLRFQRHQVGHVVQHLVELERNGLQGELARLDAGIVQHVVDQPQQRFGRQQNLFLVVALLRVQPGFQQKLPQADDGVHGRADFMTHASQKVRLGPVGLVGLVGSAGELHGAPQDQRLQVLPVLCQLGIARLKGIEHDVEAAPKAGHFVHAGGLKTVFHGRIDRHPRHQAAQVFDRRRQALHKPPSQPQPQTQRSQQNKPVFKHSAAQCGLHHIE